MREASDIVRRIHRALCIEELELRVAPAAWVNTGLLGPDGEPLQVMMMDSLPVAPESQQDTVIEVMPMGAVTLSDVPTSTWTYGCSATSAGMIFGYYDRTVYSNMYTGPTNGGVCPLTDLGQGIGAPIAGSCSIIATMNGFDGRATNGHVDDYWIATDSPGPDPWEGNWAEHTWGDCTADYMGTNQWKWDFSSYSGTDGVVDTNIDGSTSFWSYSDATKLYDFTLGVQYGTPQTALCHGLRLFAESRGYTVATNYTQKTDNQAAGGFSFGDFQAEIGAGCPVMVQVTGHSMVGIGYDVPTNTIYIHDTWDNSVHSMVWGTSYAGMDLQAITVIHLDPLPSSTPGTPDLVAGSDTGVSSSDDLTNLDNSSGGKTLQFSVGGTVAGATVRLYYGGTEIGSAVAAGATTVVTTNGTVDLPDGVCAITATQEEAGKTESDPSSGLSMTVDTIAPAAVSTPDLAAGSDSGMSSSDNITNIVSGLYNGTYTEPNIWKVELHEGATVRGTDAAPSGGTYSITSTPLSEGHRILQAYAYDTAGNYRISTLNLDVDIDTTAPTASVPDLNAASDTGQADNDNITQGNNPIFDGTASDPLSGGYASDIWRVVVSSDDSKSGTDSSAPFYSATLATLNEGTRTVSATVYDVAGNSFTTANLSVTVDRTAPTVVSDPDLAAGSDSGQANDDNITNVQTGTYTGTYTEASVWKVELLEGAVVRGTDGTPGGGTYSLTSAALAEGSHTLTARVYDVAGNTRDSSGSLLVRVDTTAPTADVPDLNAASDTGQSSSDNITQGNNPIFDGTASDPLSGGYRSDIWRVVVSSDDGKNATDSASPFYSVTLATLNEGTRTVSATVYDVAGNSYTTGNLIVRVDRSAPIATVPGLDVADDTGKSSVDNITQGVTPTFDGGANEAVSPYASGLWRVIVSSDDGKSDTDSSVGGAGGSYTATLATLNEGTRTVAATVYDVAGNSYTTANLTVYVDRTSPTGSVPDLNAASDTGQFSDDDVTQGSTPQFDGTASDPLSGGYASDIWRVVVSSDDSKSGTDSSAPFYSATLATLDEGNRTVSATVYDIAGNSYTTGALTVHVDRTIPMASIPDLMAVSDTGCWDDDNITQGISPQFDGGTADQTSPYVSGIWRVYVASDDGKSAWDNAAPFYTVTLATLDEGLRTVTATVYDVAGNSFTTPTENVMVDRTASGAPSAPDLQAGSDTGASSSDDLTSDTTPTFDISGFPRFYRVYEATLGQLSGDYESAGSWTQTTPLGGSVYSFTVRAVDDAGNVSPDSAVLAVTIDTEGPTVTSSTPDGHTSTPGTEFEFFFSEDMDWTTFDSGADVVFTGPTGGAVTGSNTPSTTRLVVQFSGTSPGANEMTIGPNISDLAGNPMDQDNDGTPGETGDANGDGIPDDAYQGRFVLNPYKIHTLAGGQVILYDTNSESIAASDILESDVLVKIDKKTGGVMAVSIIGNPDGLGIVVNSTYAKPVQLQDMRKAKVLGALNDVSFTVSTTSLKKLFLNGAVAGWDIGGVLVGEGLVLDADLDGDGTPHDLTAIYAGDATKMIKITGGLGGDVVVAGADLKGYGIGKLDVRGGDVTGDVVTLDGGLNMFTIRGGNYTGNVNVNGTLKKMDVRAMRDKATGLMVGGSVSGTITVQDCLSSLSVTDGDLSASVTVNGQDLRGYGVGMVKVRNGDVTGTIDVTTGGLKSLMIQGGDLLSNLTVSGPLSGLQVKSAKDKATGLPVGGNINGVDVLVQGELKKVMADNISNSLLAAAMIGNVNLKANLTGSTIHAGGTVDVAHNWTQGHGSIKMVNIKGNLTDSNLTAGVWLGANGLWDNSGVGVDADTVCGLAGESIISKVSVGGSITSASRSGILAATEVGSVQSKTDELSVDAESLPWPTGVNYATYNGFLIDTQGNWIA